MTSIITNSQERMRFLKFMVVGVFGAVVDFGIMNLFSKLFGMTLVWAGTISFICAIVSNFIWNRYWTYPDSRAKKVTQQLGQFVIISLIGLAIRTPLFAYLEKNLRVGRLPLIGMSRARFKSTALLWPPWFLLPCPVTLLSKASPT